MIAGTDNTNMVERSSEGVTKVMEGVRVLEIAQFTFDLFFTPRNGGHWVITGKDAIFAAATDYATFSNDPVHRFDLPQEFKQFPIHLDPPVHGVFRKVLNEILSPRTVSQLDGKIRVLANELIDAVADKGRCDFAQDIAEPLPVILFMSMMGLPLDRFAEFREWVLAGVAEGDVQKRQQTWNKVRAMSRELIEQRQQERRDDIISRLVDTEVEGGRKLTMDEMVSLCLMLFVGGLDTVVNGMSLNIRHLAIDQDLQARLRADKSLIPHAVEEILRRYTFTVPVRFVTRDVEFFGAPLKKGDFVHMFFGSADLDPRAFPNPEIVDLNRRASHLAFGAGPHRCVGAQLARVELKALLEEWLRRIPRFRLDPEKRWVFHTGHVFSIDSLPLLWD